MSRIACSSLAFCLIFQLVMVACAAEPEWSVVIPNETVTLRDPRALSIGPEEIVYISDSGNHRVIAVDSSGRLVAEAGGFGENDGQFRWPEDIAAEWGSSVWVLDYGNRRVQRLSRTLTHLASLKFASGDDTAIQSRPSRMTFAPSGDLFVFDADRSVVQRYDLNFSLQGESGGQGEYLAEIRAMTFVRQGGLCWVQSGADELHRVDPLLNSKSAVSIPQLEKDSRLAPYDTMLVIAGMNGVFLWTDGLDVDTLVNAMRLKSATVERCDGVAVATNRTVYWLDGRASRLLRFTSPR